MKKMKTPARLAQIVDDYAAGASYAQAFKMNGISPRTGWGYIAASRDGSDPELMLEMFGEKVTFERALVMSRRAVALELRSRFERDCLLGRQEVQTFNGRICWQEDPRTVGWTEDEREAFGFDRDGLLRKDGKTIPLTLLRPMAVAAQIRMLATHFEEYQETTNTKSQITHLKTTGATTPAKLRAAADKPVVPPPPPLPELTVLPDPAPAVGDDLDDLLGPEPIQNADEPVETVVEQTRPMNAPDPTDTGPMIVGVAASPDIAPTSRPLNPTLAGLLRR